MRRNIGKMLISLAAIITAVAPFLADWNDSHLFSPQWSPHARFPVAYWGPFFLAPFVPGTAVEDPGHHLVRIVGVPSNLMGAGATIITAGLGWYLDRRLRATAASAN